MRHLTLIRHAKSSWDDAVLSDFKRPLNPRGKMNAPLMGKLFKTRGVTFDIIMSSPAVRASTTAELIAREIAYPARQIEYLDALYGAGNSTLLELVQNLPDAAQRVALVAHNPGLTEFCNALCNAGIGNLPSCAIAAIRFDVETWQAVCRGSGTLQSYEYPRRHTD